MNQLKFYAHGLDDDSNPAHWQELADHLDCVARKAGEFAEAFHSREWGYLAGLWHDLGKYQFEFQQKLLGSRVSVEHSGAGAALAAQRDKEHGMPLAFAIAGHHAGLANLIGSNACATRPLRERIRENEPLLKKIVPNIPDHIHKQSVPDFPPFLRVAEGLKQKDLMALRRRVEFWTRFLFSALVDADRLNTEEFTNHAQASLRRSFAPVGTLQERVDAFIESKVTALSHEERTSPVNLVRAQVLEACRRAAQQPPGIFGLSAPTGGGKTLSAMSFALRHAECRDLRRVIVVIPYTSIIEQNAAQYRQALGSENVLEHHSNLDPDVEKARHGEEVTRRHELACENWDAPVIVTTTVQFFESLFSSHPSRCRKLHNIARSVIILDEVQTVPPGFLLSILDALNQLISHYGCSVVLSTATPPALAARDGFDAGLRNILEIVSDSRSLAEQVDRIEYAWPDINAPALDWPALAKEVAKHRQVLAVVHKRDDARVLAQRVQKILPGEPVLHLSALMCGAHRSHVLARVKEMLACGEACRVVSTQLVEAGVDVDFPVVYRALGGLDSMVQAAGRCNREGRLAKGRVVVFRAPTAPPQGTLRRGMEVTECMLREAGGTLDIHDRALFETYFRMLYFAENQDVKQIQTLRQQFNFVTVGKEFRLIEDSFTRPVIVPYGDAPLRLEELRRKGPDRETMRRLQTFTVNIYPDAFTKLFTAGALEEIAEGVFTLSHGFERLYDLTFGLAVGDEPRADPKAFLV